MPNAIKVLLQVTSVSLQPVPSLEQLGKTQSTLTFSDVILLRYNHNNIQGVFEVEAFLVTRGTIHYS
jgi:hypothetical protein